MIFPILLGISALVFIALPFVLKSHVGYAFLALSAGELLSVAAGRDFANIIRSIAPGANFPAESVAKIVLLALPPLLTLLLLKGSIKSVKLMANLLPGFCATVLAALLLTAKLPQHVTGSIQSTELYIELLTYQTITIVVGMASTLLMVYVDRPKGSKKHGKH